MVGTTSRENVSSRMTCRLGNIHMINLRGCSEPASGPQDPIDLQASSIGSNRHADLVRNTHSTARLSRVFYRLMTGRWESVTFGQGLTPTVPKFCKTLCGLAGHTKRLPTDSACDFHVNPLDRRWDIPKCDCVHRSFTLFRDQCERIGSG